MAPRRARYRRAHGQDARQRVVLCCRRCGLPLTTPVIVEERAHVDPAPGIDIVPPGSVYSLAGRLLANHGDIRVMGAALDTASSAIGSGVSWRRDLRVALVPAVRRVLGPGG